MISAASRDHILGRIGAAEADGGEVLVDGRGWSERKPGTWVGPTVIVKSRNGNKGDGKSEEIFGPVLMVVKVHIHTKHTETRVAPRNFFVESPFVLGETTCSHIPRQFFWVHFRSRGAWCWSTASDGLTGKTRL